MNPITTPTTKCVWLVESFRYGYQTVEIVEEGKTPPAGFIALAQPALCTFYPLPPEVFTEQALAAIDQHEKTLTAEYTLHLNQLTAARKNLLCLPGSVSVQE